MVVGTRRAGLSISKTIIKHFWLTLNKNPPIHYLNKLEYLRPIQKHFKCWASGKYVNLLYMYSILGRGSFCFNYCLNSAWRGGDQFVALLRWYEAQVSLTVAFSSSAFFGLLFLIFLLTIPHRFSMWGSGLVSLLDSQAHQHHGHLTNFWCFLQCGQEPNPAENEFSTFKKLFSRRKHEVLQN